MGDPALTIPDDGANSWRFECAANLEGLEPYSLTWDTCDGTVLLAALDSEVDSDHVVLTITSRLGLGTFDDQQALEVAGVAAGRISVVVAFPIGPPQLRERTVAGERRETTGPWHYDLRLARHQLAKRFESVAFPPLAKEPLVTVAAQELFREALVASDDIAKYILCWQVLLCLTRNADANADDLVLSHRPELLLEERSRRGKRQSVLGVLRHRIAHMGEQLPPAELNVGALRGDLKKWLPELRDIAREAILARVAGSE